jgi:hypothetical protein
MPWVCCIHKKRNPYGRSQTAGLEKVTTFYDILIAFKQPNLNVIEIAMNMPKYNVFPVLAS